MGMIRVIVFGFAIWLIYKFYQRWKARMNAKPEAKTGVMVKCQHCGTHLPQERALKSGDQWFCNQEHQAEHERQSD